MTDALQAQARPILSDEDRAYALRCLEREPDTEFLVRVLGLDDGDATTKPARPVKQVDPRAHRWCKEHDMAKEWAKSSGWRCRQCHRDYQAVYHRKRRAEKRAQREAAK